MKLTEKKEIVFWKKAKKLILSGYGKKHCHPEEMDIDCIQCRASFAVAWINGHISLLQWTGKKVKTFKKK